MALASGTWPAFHGLTGTMLIVGNVATALAMAVGWPGLLLAPPLLASLGLIIYFPLVGRLAWACAERLEQADEDEE